MTKEQQQNPPASEQPKPEDERDEAEENRKLDEAIEMTFPASDPISI